MPDQWPLLIFLSDMRRSVYIGVVIVALFVGGFGCATYKLIVCDNSYNNLDEAVIEARYTHKLLLVVFYSEWCPQCHEFFNTTLSDPLVQKKLYNKYILVKIDTLKELEIKREFGINKRPTIIIMDCEKRELVRIVGMIKVDELLSKI